MALTDEQKAERDFQRRLENCRSMDIGRYNRKTAKIFQEMIRAEEGAMEGNVPAVVKGQYQQVYSPLVHCVCVTCGAVLPWGGTNEIDAGHFNPGRKITDGLFEETNVHPQCKPCNKKCSLGDSLVLQAYSVYIENRYGMAELMRLREMKNDKNHFWLTYLPGERQEWAVNKRIECQSRLNAALEVIG